MAVEYKHNRLKATSDIRPMVDRHWAGLREAKERGENIVVRTHVRDMPILPEMVGAAIAVYNGREFLEIEIQPQMIGHLLGEFSPSTKVVRHGAPGIGATRSSLYVPLK